MARTRMKAPGWGSPRSGRGRGASTSCCHTPTILTGWISTRRRRMSVSGRSCCWCAASPRTYFIGGIFLGLQRGISEGLGAQRSCRRILLQMVLLFLNVQQRILLQKLLQMLQLWYLIHHVILKRNKAKVHSRGAEGRMIKMEVEVLLSKGKRQVRPEGVISHVKPGVEVDTVTS
uniref:Uncharacterized protein n=1 Tax=Triticum urartu TaxID=4572 RepID=A0A8R7PZ77_TRIUA